MVIEYTFKKVIATIIELFVMIILVIIVTAGVIKYNRIEEPYNFIELQAQFKNYTLLDKYPEEPNRYIFRLRNPVNNKVEKVYVKDYLYYKTYFVGDIIK